jgi:3-phenylpropionate/trans-cinnamate dioxygenase ferredoxin subunit
VSARAVIDVSGLAPGTARGFDVAGRSVLVCFAEGRFYALDNLCPHQAFPLAGGRLDGCVYECPHHGGKLDVRDGSPRRPPIRRAVSTYAVREAEGGLEIDFGAGAGAEGGER